MRLNTLEEINAYMGNDEYSCVGKTKLWAVLPSYGNNETSIHSIHIASGKSLRDFDPETNFAFEFVGSFGMRVGNINTDAVFTDLSDAQAYLQEKVNNISVSEDLSGATVGIYKGGFVSGMERINSEVFKWSDNDKYGKSITLNEIYKQAAAIGLVKERETLTVFHTTPLNGTIYQCGNYNKGMWVEVGTTKGYA